MRLSSVPILERQHVGGDQKNDLVDVYDQKHDVDRELMGLLVSEVTDLHAPELLPEVKALFDAGAVHEGTSGDYKSVARDIKKQRFENPLSLYSFNAESRFKAMRDIYNN